MNRYYQRAWSGETIPFLIEYDTDIDATAELIILQDDKIVKTKSEVFVNREADLTLTAGENIDLGVGVFNWLVKITYDSGEVDILPDIADCVDCEKPVLEICEVEDVTES